MYKIPIIVFEGIEGSGKSHHIKKVANYLKRKKLNRYDKFNNIFYNKVQKGFLKISKKNIKKYSIIDSNLDIKKNEILIINKIKRLLK